MARLNGLNEGANGLLATLSGHSFTVGSAMIVGAAETGAAKLAQ